MKKLMMMVFCVVGFLGFGMNSAEARCRPANGPVYLAGYLSCGTPIYQQRVFVGYDCAGRPLYQVRRVHRSHRSSWDRRRARSNRVRSRLSRQSQSCGRVDRGGRVAVWGRW